MGDDDKNNQGQQTNNDIPPVHNTENVQNDGGSSSLKKIEVNIFE